MPLPPPTTVNIDPYYEGLTTGEMIEIVRRRLGVSATDENRYPAADVIQALNQGCLRFVKLTGCLSIPAIVIGKKDKQFYRAPYGTLRIRAARFYTGDTKSTYRELAIKRDMREMQRINSTFRGDAGYPNYLFPAYRSGNVRTFGVSPIPNADGSVFDADAYGLLVTATGYQTVGNIQGTHKAGYEASAFLVDAEGRDMSDLGALVGYPVLNTTDGSQGVITTIGDQDAVNDKVTATLTGGTNNYWTPGDAFLIPMGEYGVVADGDTETYTVSNLLGTVANIAGGLGNFGLDCVRRPLALSADMLTAICEIPQAYQEAPIAFAVYWLGSGQFGGLVQNSKAVAALGLFNQYVAEYTSEDDLVDVSANEIEYLEEYF